MGVVIPARDESRSIEDCVLSVRRALARERLDAWLVVVADRCRDDTAARARRALGGCGEVVVSRWGMVGAARQLGCRRVLQRFAHRPLERVWLLATDADSMVPCDWIRAHRDAADLGAHAVAGTVRVRSFSTRAARLRDRYESAYARGSDGHVPHVHGANFGVRADAFSGVGGWSRYATGEDRDLWLRLVEAGYRVVPSNRAPVWTSARRRGRAPDGFASYLNRLEAGLDLTRS
jgi:cellulose synthase/poly-beta-1,6-N-acetylglucosamine synthase-like glycosyltransferase